VDDNPKLSRKDFEDYEFIASELSKMAKMNFAEIREHQKHHPEDNLFTLHHPRDNHLMLFTREGAKRFRQVARRSFKSLGTESRKYDLNIVISKVKELFLTRLLENTSSLNDEHAHEIFLQAIAEISKDFLGTTHYIPCSLVAQSVPSQFHIGPVEFQLSEVFWDKNGQSIRGNLKHESQHEPIKQFFTQQRWVASVQVGPCDPIVSATRATETVQLSLDLFKLFAGRSRGADVRHAYIAGLPWHTSRLYSDETGFHITQIWAFRNAVLKDAWLEDIAGFLPWIFGEQTISARLERWENLPELEQRFLDALTWHSDGISEASAPARILKFWIAIERTLSSKIRDRVSMRAAIFSAEAKDFCRQFEKCQRLYSLRSEIVHGTYHGTDEKLESSAQETEKISEAVVTSYAFMAAQLKCANAFSRTGIEAEFKRLDRIAARPAP
jgi:hypothetical protein